MTQAAQPKNIKLTIVQKYGLKFYISAIPQIITLLILAKTQYVPLAISFVSFFNQVGNFLPFKADKQRQKQINNIQKNNKYLLLPLITSCASTPLILLFLWRNYDTIVGNSMADNITILFTIGFIISGSIDAAHQLLHRTQSICQFFSYLNLFFLQFTIYPTEHLFMHHKKVGTKQDAITAPKNKTIYAFYVNALYSGYKFNFGYSKKIFAFNVGSTLFYNLLLIGFALKEGSSLNKALFFSLISYFTLFIMEAVQYIQHYGLIYRSDEKSKPIIQICSWNTQQCQLMNWSVFRFQRHSDHHMTPHKIYPTLNLDQKMPKFPFDFASGIVMSIISPLWFKLVNPLVDEIILGVKATEQHRILVKRAFGILKILLVGLFPLRLIQYLLLTYKM